MTHQFESLEAEVDRLADGLLEAVSACHCDHAGAAIVSGYDVKSRDLARMVSSRLIGQTTVTVTRRFTGEVNPDRLAVLKHWCAVVDIDSGSPHTSAAAAQSGARVITLGVGMTSTEAVPVMRSDCDSSPVAVQSYRIEPEHPDFGTLLLQIDNQDEQTLPSGSAIQLRCERDAMVVDIGRHRDEPAMTRTAGRVLVHRLTGVHPLRRDGFTVGELPTYVEFTHDPTGFMRIAV